MDRVMMFIDMTPVFYFLVGCALLIACEIVAWWLERKRKRDDRAAK